MPRVKRGIMHRKRASRIMKDAKGYKGARSRRLKSATEAVNHAMAYSYRDRRAKKRDFRSLWIVRINAEARVNGLSYSKMMDGLKKAGVTVNRKMLAEMAVSDKSAFAKLAKIAAENVEKTVAAVA